MNERDIFIAALHQRDPAERAALLDRHCAADQALRARIEELLREQERLGSFLERPAEARGQTGVYTSLAGEVAAGLSERPGTVIGPYKLMEQMRWYARGKNDASWKKLVAIARLADPDSWRNRCREAFLRRDRQALEQLAQKIPIRQVMPKTLWLLAIALKEVGAPEQAVELSSGRKKPSPTITLPGASMSWDWRSTVPVNSTKLCKVSPRPTSTPGDTRS